VATGVNRYGGERGFRRCGRHLGLSEAKRGLDVAAEQVLVAPGCKMGLALADDGP